MAPLDSPEGMQAKGVRTVKNHLERTTHRNHAAANATRASPRRDSAYTLLEVVFSLLIATIALGVAAIRLSRSSVSVARGERVARRLVADLRFAQSESIALAKNHYLLFVDGEAKYASYAIYRVETGDDVLVEPDRVMPDTVALTGSALRAEFAPGGDALAGYTYRIVSPGRRWNITVVLATGAVMLSEER